MNIREYIDSMTPERILRLACRPDGLAIHRYRYREEKIAARARELVRAGKLKRVGRDRDTVYYKATPVGRASLSEMTTDIFA